MQWWGLCTFAANGPGMILGWELKILQAEWHGQKQKNKKQNWNPLTDSISQNCAALDSALPTTTLKTSFSSSRSAVSWRPPCIVWVSLAAKVGGQEKTHDDRWSELHLEKLIKKKKRKANEPGAQPLTFEEEMLGWVFFRISEANISPWHALVMNN